MPKSTAIVTAAPSKPHTQSAELDGTAPWLAFEGKGNNDGIYDDTELADLLKRLCGAHALSSGNSSRSSTRPLRLGSSRLCLLRHHRGDAFRIKSLPALVEMTASARNARHRRSEELAGAHRLTTSIRLPNGSRIYPKTIEGFEAIEMFAGEDADRRHVGRLRRH